MFAFLSNRIYGRVRSAFCSAVTQTVGAETPIPAIFCVRGTHKLYYHSICQIVPSMVRQLRSLFLVHTGKLAGSRKMHEGLFSLILSAILRLVLAHDRNIGGIHWTCDV